MQPCSFIEAFFKSLIAVCVSSTVAVKNRIVAFKSHITARHVLTTRRATRNFRFRRPMAMILSLVMALQLLMVFASATSGTTSKPDPWRDGPRDLYFYDGMMGGGEHWPKGHVTVSNHEVTVEVEEGASLLGYVVPAGKYNMKELAQKYAMTIWLTEERACLALSLAKGEQPFMDEPVPVKLDGKPTNVELDGAYMHINPEQLGKLNLPVAVVTTAGYLDLSYVADSLGGFCEDDYLDMQDGGWQIYYNFRLQTVVKKVTVNNLTAIKGVWYEQSGSNVKICESYKFSSYYWDEDAVPDYVKRYVDIIRYSESTDIVDICVRYSDNGEEPVSVHANDSTIAWSNVNPRQTFLFRGERGTVTYMGATSLINMAGGYTDKGYVKNSDGPDVAWYKLHDGRTVRFMVGTPFCDVDGESKDLLENITVMDGTTLVPVRAGEKLGMTVKGLDRTLEGMLRVFMTTPFKIAA